MADPTQRLPVELLAEILGLASTPEILRFNQVNRVFRDVIHSSPLIQHKIELFAAGFEYNAATGASLAESRKAFHQYRSNLDSLHLIEERVVDGIQIPDDNRDLMVVGDVYAFVKDSARFFSLGSTSRGIPYKEWKIPLPTIGVESYGFYPDADVIAFIELQEVNGMQIAIHLRTLSSGECHPAARCPIILYSQEDVNVYDAPFVSITSSRLVVLMGVRHGMLMVIWDWKSAQVLFAHKNDRFGYDSVEFIDEYRLLVGLGSSKDEPSCIVLMDTKKNVGGGSSQTPFYLPPYFRGHGHRSIILERGAHKPSPAESLAPFHHDPTQRIVASLIPHSFGYFVFPVEPLLQLAEGREGSGIGWDEWKEHVVIPSIPRPDLVDVWVSGCRLFSIPIAEGHNLDAELEVYDFSMRGRSKYLSEQVDPDFGGVRYLEPTGPPLQFPWEVEELFDVDGGHGSVVFFRIRDSTGDGHSAEEGVLHVWTF